MADFIIDDLLKKADEAVIAGNAGLPERITAKIATQRLAEREQLLYDGLAKYSELKGALNKFKPDDKRVEIQPDGSGKTVEAWKPETWKGLNEAKKKLADFKQAYIWAVDGRYRNANGKWIDNPSDDQIKKDDLKKIPDYEPLKKALKGGGGGGEKKDSEQESTEQ